MKHRISAHLLIVVMVGPAWGGSNMEEKIYQAVMKQDAKGLQTFIAYPVKVTEHRYDLSKDDMCLTYAKSTQAGQWAELKGALSDIRECWKLRKSMSREKLEEEEQNGIYEGWETRESEDQKNREFVGWSAQTDCVHLCGVMIDKHTKIIKEFIRDTDSEALKPNLKGFHVVGKSAITN